MSDSKAEPSAFASRYIDTAALDWTPTRFPGAFRRRC